MPKQPQVGPQIFPLFAVGGAMLAIVFANFGIRADMPLRIVFIAIAISCIMASGMAIAMMFDPRRRS